MKQITILLLMGCVSLLFTRCTKELELGQTSLESKSPGKVTVNAVTPIPGGAIISYTAPTDKDLLYVKAEFLRNGEVSTALASNQMDKVKIDGLAPHTTDVEVKVSAVDFNRNESEPVTVTFTPLESPLISILESFELTPDFGGCNAKWTNPTNTEIGITMLYDTLLTGEYEKVLTYYSEAEEGTHLFEFSDKEASFKVFLTDKWGNISPEKEFTLQPFYSKLFTQDDITKIDITTDFTTDYGSGYGYSGLFDGSTSKIYISKTNPNGFPLVMTLDFGSKVKFNKYRMWQRYEYDLEFTHWNVRDYEIWGAQELKAPITDAVYWSNDATFGRPWRLDWTLMTDAHTYKPGGDDNPVSAEDKAAAREGYGETFDSSLPPFRYLRIVNKMTWAGIAAWQISEMQIYGDNKSEF